MKHADNMFLITRSLIGNLRYGKTGNLFTTLFGMGSWPFFIVDDGSVRRGDVAALLEREGVPMWGWGYSHGRYTFCVPKQDGLRAEQALIQAGYQIDGRRLSG